jgi:hypothetical protein
MWPLVLALVVVGEVGAEMICPGLEMMYLPPQCINDRHECLQDSIFEPASKVCNMCDGCTAYIREYWWMLFKTRLQFVLRNGALDAVVCCVTIVFLSDNTALILLLSSRQKQNYLERTFIYML